VNSAAGPETSADSLLWAAVEAASPWQFLPDGSDLNPALDFDDSSERVLSQSDRRRSFIALYGWAVPTREAIRAIASFVGDRRLLEVCAGGGLWARLLGGAGLQVKATDAEPVADSHFSVQVLDAEAAVKNHRDCEALLMVWPPFRQDCAFRALNAFAGDRLIYVGDSRFTADGRFHDLIDAEWLLADRLPIPAWPGLDDHVFLYKRRQSS
jgi:hypothetical protein